MGVLAAEYFVLWRIALSDKLYYVNIAMLMSGVGTSYTQTSDQYCAALGIGHLAAVKWHLFVLVSSSGGGYLDPTWVQSSLAISTYIIYDGFDFPPPYPSKALHYSGFARLAVSNNT